MLTLAFMLALQAEKPTATIKLDAATVAVGKPLKGKLILTLPEGQHGYQNPPADEFENPIKLRVVEKGFKLATVAYPKGIELKMEGATKPSKVYEGTIEIPFTLVAGVGASTTRITNVNFALDYQLCTMSNCYPPSSLTLKAPVKVVRS